LEFPFKFLVMHTSWLSSGPKELEAFHIGPGACIEGNVIAT
jgi:hypothetical protein